MTKQQLTNRDAIRAAIRQVNWVPVEISTGVVRLRALTNAEILGRLTQYPEVVGILANAFEAGSFSARDIIFDIAPRIVEGASIFVAMAMEGVTADEVDETAADLRSLQDFGVLRKAQLKVQAPDGVDAFFAQFLEDLGLDGLVSLVAQTEGEQPQAA